jgi:hypothetical protein
MKTWLKIHDGVVICMVRQSETPPDDETGFWIVQPHAFAGPGWLYADGEVTRPPNFVWMVVTNEAYLARFTAEEIAAIRASTNENAQLAIATIDGLEKVHVVAPQVINCINVFAANGLIATERASSFLEPAKPHEEAPVTIPTSDGDTP